MYSRNQEKQKDLQKNT